MTRCLAAFLVLLACPTMASAELCWDPVPGASYRVYDGVKLLGTTSATSVTVPPAGSYQVSTVVAGVEGPRSAVAASGAPCPAGVALMPPPAPLPPTMPSAPVLRESGVSQCRFVLRAEKPDATSGWSAQFRRNGVHVGSRDSSPPYERTVRVAPGLYSWDVAWTKSGVPSRTSALVKTGVTCQAIP